MVMYKIDRRGGWVVVQKSYTRTDPKSFYLPHLLSILYLTTNIKQNCF